jgi:soluble lytic murein transglycosylase
MTDIDYAIADWRRLRQSDGYAFADYARFLANNPDWPGESSMRRAAERQMRPGENPATVIAFFSTDPPTIGNGFARLSDSYSATARPTEALAAAREALAASGLSAYDEYNLMARFGRSLAALDYDRRLDRLLSDRQATDAQRLLPYSSAVRRAAFQARIAMQLRSSDVETLYAKVMPAVTSDAGLMIDRARYLREANWESAARQLAARPHSFTTRPIDPEKWFELQLLLARGAAADGQYTMAYNIARQVDDALPAGTDLSLKPLGVRDDYTSLTWFGGTIALNYLRKPADAIALFDRYSRGGRSLQVASKGYYWAGRAAAQAGRPEATSYFQRAAAYPELFYGQLALERLGRPVPAPAGVPNMLVTDAQRTAFSQKRLVRATRRLGQSGARAEQALFVRALSETLKTDADRVLATELATQIGRQDLAVWTARSARNNGSTFYMRPAFPTIASGAPSGRMWSVANGITRQESSFDRTAISGAGARGMMQLMLPTARETAGKMGVGYDYSRLTTDPAYNVMLGSYYFQRMLNTWGGSYPLAVASYNAGSGNVRKWINANGDPRQANVDMVRWIENIPFTETRGYVQRVLENAVVYDRLNPSPTPPASVHISAYLGKSRPG